MWIVSQWWLYDIHLDCLLSGSFPCQTVLCPANYSNKYNWNEKSSLFFDSRMLSNKSELVIYRFAWFRLEWKNGKRLMKSWPFFFYYRRIYSMQIFTQDDQKRESNNEMANNNKMMTNTNQILSAHFCIVFSVFALYL